MPPHSNFYVPLEHTVFSENVLLLYWFQLRESIQFSQKQVFRRDQARVTSIVTVINMYACNISPFLPIWMEWDCRRSVRWKLEIFMVVFLEWVKWGRLRWFATGSNVFHFIKYIGVMNWYFSLKCINSDARL